MICPGVRAHSPADQEYNPFFLCPSLQISLPNHPSLDHKALGDFPPSCRKQDLGLVLSASPLLEGAGLSCWRTARIQAPGKYLQLVPCQDFRFKNLGKSRDDETDNSTVIHAGIRPLEQRGCRGFTSRCPHIPSLPGEPPPCRASHGSLSDPVSRC